MKRIVICLGVSVCILLPQFAHRYPSLLDISETVNYKSPALLSVAQYAFTEKDRFMPLYYLVRSPVASACQYLGPCYFSFYVILLGITVCIICAMVGARIVPTLFFLLFNPILIDAFWRLGAAETTLGLFLLISYIAYTRGWTRLFIFALIAGSLCKETFIFYVAAFGVHALIWKRKEALFICSILIIAATIIIPREFRALHSVDSYAGSIRIPLSHISTIASIVSSYAVQYAPLFTALAICAVILGPFQFIFFLIIAGLVPLATTNNVQGYYLLPTLYLCALALNESFVSWQTRSSSRGKIWHATAVYILLTVLFLPKTIERASFWYEDYVADNALIRWVQHHGQKYGELDIEGRSEYQAALRYMLSDAGFWEEPSSSEFDCRQDGEYVMRCRRPHILTGAAQALLTQNPQNQTAVLLCERNWQWESTCRWYVVSNASLQVQ